MDGRRALVKVPLKGTRPRLPRVMGRGGPSSNAVAIDRKGVEGADPLLLVLSRGVGLGAWFWCAVHINNRALHVFGY